MVKNLSVFLANVMTFHRSLTHLILNSTSSGLLNKSCFQFCFNCLFYVFTSIKHALFTFAVVCDVDLLVKTQCVFIAFLTFCVIFQLFLFPSTVVGRVNIARTPCLFRVPLNTAINNRVSYQNTSCINRTQIYQRTFSPLAPSSPNIRTQTRHQQRRREKKI